jgi:hypothetical protein
VIDKLLRLKNGRFLLTSYEKMGENLELEISRISSFTGLSPIPEMKGFVEIQKQKQRSKTMLSMERKKKLAILKPMASQDCFDRLINLNDCYLYLFENLDET